MLKSIKKTTRQEEDIEPQPQKIAVDSSVIKKQAMMEEEEEVDREELRINGVDKMINEKEEEEYLAVYRECYNLFIQGNS